MNRFKKKCEFDVSGTCYAWVCYSAEKCGAKDGEGHIVRIATMEEIMERERQIEKNDGVVYPATSDEDSRKEVIKEREHTDYVTKADRREHRHKR
jgi:hypothetical protein